MIEQAKKLYPSGDVKFYSPEVIKKNLEALGFKRKASGSILLRKQIKASGKVKSPIFVDRISTNAS
jgi:phage FluMu protein gp41